VVRLPADLHPVRTEDLSAPKAIETTVDLAPAADCKALVPKVGETIDDRLAPADDLMAIAAETADGRALDVLTLDAAAKADDLASATGEAALAVVVVVDSADRAAAIVVPAIAPKARADAVASAEAETAIVAPALAPKAVKVTEVVAPNDLART